MNSNTERITYRPNRCKTLNVINITLIFKKKNVNVIVLKLLEASFYYLYTMFKKEKMH